MQPKGSSRKDVLAELKKLHSQDRRYEDGKILCSMCTKPHPIAKKAYEMFFESNLGDQGLFPGTAQLENEVVAQLSHSSPQRKRRWLCGLRRNRSKPPGTACRKKHRKHCIAPKLFCPNQPISRLQKPATY